MKKVLNFLQNRNRQGKAPTAAIMGVRFLVFHLGAFTPNLVIQRYVHIRETAWTQAPDGAGGTCPPGSYLWHLQHWASALRGFG